MIMPQEEKQVPLRWHYPEELRSLYASQFVVQHTDQEFYLSFFEAPPPIIIGSAEERQQMLDDLDEVVTTCVARLVIHPGRLPELIGLLQKNYESFLRSSAAEDADDDDIV
jgi:hypothetical protein